MLILFLEVEGLVFSLIFLIEENKHLLSSYYCIEDLRILSNLTELT